MSIFGRIKDAIFGHEEDASRRSVPAGPSPASATRPAVRDTVPSPANNRVATDTEASRPVIDVENHLDSMPGADSLNWRTSIVDLMKLIGVDSDFESRKALAGEMGRTEYSGSTEDNVWLHRRVMNGLASNGGRVPAEFLD